MEDEEGVLREQNDESLPYGARRTQHTDFDFLSFEIGGHVVFVVVVVVRDRLSM